MHLIQRDKNFHSQHLCTLDKGRRGDEHLQGLRLLASCSSQRVQPRAKLPPSDDYIIVISHSTLLTGEFPVPGVHRRGRRYNCCLPMVLVASPPLFLSIFYSLSVVFIAGPARRSFFLDTQSCRAVKLTFKYTCERKTSSITGVLWCIVLRWDENCNYFQ